MTASSHPGSTRFDVLEASTRQIIDAIAGGTGGLLADATAARFGASAGHVCRLLVLRADAARELKGTGWEHGPIQASGLVLVIRALRRRRRGLEALAGVLT